MRRALIHILTIILLLSIAIAGGAAGLLYFPVRVASLVMVSVAALSWLACRWRHITAPPLWQPVVAFVGLWSVSVLFALDVRRALLIGW
jgi:hypothetical protein